MNELIPGLEDFVEEIPVPEQEEGSNEVTEPENLDEKPITPGNVDVTIDIENNREQTRQESLEETTKQMIAKLDSVLTLANNAKLNRVSQEDFGSFVKNSFTGIINVLGHVTNLFATTILYGWRDFKRSELTEYSDSNRLTMTRIYKLGYSELSELTLPTPKGMLGKYSDALKVIEKFLNDLDLSHKADQMLDLVTAIRDDLHKQNPNFTSHVRDANRLMLADSVMKNFNDTGKIFSTKEREEDLFKNLFNDPKDLEVTVKKCMDMDTHLRAVASIHDRVKDIEAIVESIGGELNNVQINKFQLDDLAKMVKMFANIFTAYATVINDLYRVNHNLTWCIKEIRKVKNM